MLIYLDTNVYQRPFNDQTQSRIRREALAFIEILAAVESKQTELLGSEILEFEIEQIPEKELRARVKSYLKLCAQILHATEQQLKIAQQLENECGFKGRDALHIAAACAGKASYFVTCDERIVRHLACGRDVTRENGFAVELMRPEQFIARLKTDKEK
ncbi:MAG: PIN domain-containing protein [Chloroflexi bacterium]|nr:PIN domain-containing protein [Chloroflexota bacterium]